MGGSITKIERLKKQIPMLQDIVSNSKNYYKFLYKRWLFLVGCFVIGAVIGLLIIPMVLPPNTTLGNASTVSDIAQSLIDPSITINGLFLAIIPTIGFFYVSDIKEDQKENEKAFREDTKEFTSEEELKTVKSAYILVNAFWYNTRVGVLKYIRLHIVVSLFSLMILIFVYIALTPKNFIIIDAVMLFSILSGILPITLTALTKPVIEF